MESYGRSGNQNSNLDRLQQSDLKLRYMTYDARALVESLGMQDLTLFWQVLLMEHLYNYNNSSSVITQFKKMRDAEPGIPANQIVRGFSEVRSRVKPQHAASFNETGIRNLFALDRSILFADYSTRLEALAKMLNDIPNDILSEWAEDEGHTSMPILMLKLETFLFKRNKAMREVEREVDPKIFERRPTSTQGNAVLKEALKEIKEIGERTRGEDKI